ncbi:MAG: enoyl-CoA hydratase [Ilumatobacteraceae bacterium]
MDDSHTFPERVPVILVERRGPVAIVTLNRPDARNALNAELAAAFPQAVATADADPDVQAIVLTGSDPAFCAGFDRRDVDSGEKKGENPHPGHWTALPRTRVPVIGAINGAAVTGGLEIALACDFLVASERARFADTHTKVGMVPGWGLTVLLPRLIGPARARFMSFTGEFVDAATALAWGLVVEVTPHDRLVERAIEIGNAIASTHADATTETRALYDDVRPLGDSDDAFAVENQRARLWAAKRFGGAS